MYKHFLLAILLSFSATFMTLGQVLPMEMRLSLDGRMLLTGGNSSSGLYDSSIIRSFYLNFAQPNYWNLLLSNYASKTDILATLIVDNQVYDSVGVRFRGNTSYMFAGNSQKKPFNISVDYALDDQRLMGYKTLNLNNNQGDASFLREIFYLHQIRKHVPAAKASFVRLFLNNSDWGLYTHVQQLNKDFIEEWFLSHDGINWRADKPDSISGGSPGANWGDGTAALNYLGSDTLLYQAYYTLKSSEVSNPWEKLVAGCNALNNTPLAQLPDVLPDFFDVDRVLWFLAAENAFADDDSYIMKGKMDYYVYYEVETERLTPIEYDGNSILASQAVNWSPFKNESNVNYPLLNKILAVPEWRQRYLAHLRTIIAESMNPASTGVIIDNLKAQIEVLYQADPKKMFSYFQMINGVTSLKSIVNNRRNFLLSHAEVSQQGPSISDLIRYNSAMQPWVGPLANEDIVVTAQVSSSVGVSQVYLYFSTGLVGSFNRVEMFDDGLHQDGQAGDGVYGSTIPGQAAGQWVRFYVEARASNGSFTSSFLPEGAEHNVFICQVYSQAAQVSGVVINELMADNVATIQDPAGEYDDWFELYNTNNYDVDLGGCYLSDKLTNPGKWQIPDSTIIPAHGYLIFWADDQGSQGLLHTNFALSKNGEALILSDSLLNIIDSVTFGPQLTDMSYARLPNGTGSWVIQAPTFNASNNGPVFIEEVISSEPLLVFPNPAKEFIMIQAQMDHLNREIQVFNSLGRLILQQEFHGSLQLDCSSWHPGLYFLGYDGKYVKCVVVP